MISKPSIVAGIAMLLLSFSLSANITTTLIDHTLYVQSDQQATEGYRGCDLASAQKVSAYTFELQTQQGNSNPTCSAGNTGGRWRTINRQNSSDGTAVFENLPDGKYRIICLSGQAIGCTIEGDTKGLPDQSIVFEKEISKLILLGASPTKATATTSSNTPINHLKVFPNPANKQITIALDNSDMEQTVQISLINLLGQELQHLQGALDKNISSYQWMLDVSTQNSGTYFIRLRDVKGQSLQQKIVILKND